MVRLLPSALARQLILHRISEIVSMYVCMYVRMYPSRLGMQLFRALRANVRARAPVLNALTYSSRINIRVTRSLNAYAPHRMATAHAGIKGGWPGQMKCSNMAAEFKNGKEPETLQARCTGHLALQKRIYGQLRGAAVPRYTCNVLFSRFCVKTLKPWFLHI